MNSESHEKVVTTDAVPNLQVKDLYAYATSTKVIANIIIKTSNGEQKRRLMRTKTGGYMMQ